METKVAYIPSFRDFLHIVFKRKEHILLSFGIVVCAVILGTFSGKPTYEAVSQILVKVGRENLYVPEVPTSTNLSSLVRYDREDQINSEIEILTSTILVENVVESLGPTVIYEDMNSTDKGFLTRLFPNSSSPPQQSFTEIAALRLQKHLTVKGIKDSSVIEVRFKHTDPQIAASVTNKLINLYLDRHLDVYRRPQSYKFFQEQSQILKSKLEQSERELQAFKKRHNITALNEQRSLLLRQEADLRTGLNDALRSEAEAANRIALLRQQMAATPETVPQGENIDHNLTLISTLQARLVELELEEKALLAKYTNHSRLVQNVRDEIRMVREKLSEQETKKYGRSSFGPNETYQRLLEDLYREERDVKALKANKETLTAQLDEYQRKLEEVNRIEVELNRLQDKIEVDRQNYRLYLSKFEESRISDAMDAEKIANVTQIQPARPPLKPVSPKVVLNLVLGIFLAATGGFGLAFFLEYLDDRLDRPELAEDVLGLPVLASIPVLKQ